MNHALQDCINFMFSTAISMFNAARFVKKRTILNREYNIFKLDDAFKLQLFRVSCEYFRSKGIFCENLGAKMLIFYGNSDEWYKVGLILSDGALLKQQGYILFSTSNPHSMFCILDSFSKAKIYFRYYMYSLKTECIIPIFNVLVYDLNAWLKAKSISHDIIGKLSREELTSFLAGVVDGDGSIDKDNIRVSIPPNDILYEVLLYIFKDRCRYDASKFLLRLSTPYLREKGYLKDLATKVKNPKKRLKIAKILNKKHRFITISNSEITALDKMALKLNDHEVNLLQRAKVETKTVRGRKGVKAYKYIVWYSTDENVKVSILHTITKLLSAITNSEISRFVKIYCDRIVIYSQPLVNVILHVLDKLKEN